MIFTPLTLSSLLGHCRRRKIRCLLAKDDPQGRCSNCIRLKKDCSFYPVDATDRRPRSMSKPDISQEPASEASSPSPGLSGRVPHAAEPPRGYPASVPVTPTYDFAGSFDDSLRSHVQHPISRSTNVSRKTSLARIHTPLTLKVEQRFLSPGEGYGPQWEVTSQSDTMTPATEPFHALEGTAAAYWRLASPRVPASPYMPPYVSPLQSLDAMGQIGSAELQDDSTAWSQASSRMGSIDQGMPPAYALGSYSSETDFVGLPPGLVSTNASTVSLTASVSEYGDNRGPFYVNQWGGDLAGPNSYESGPPLKTESYDSNPAFYMDEGSPYPLPSQPSQHGVPPVGMSHV